MSRPAIELADKILVAIDARRQEVAKVDSSLLDIVGRAIAMGPLEAGLAAALSSARYVAAAMVDYYWDVRIDIFPEVLLQRLDFSKWFQPDSGDGVTLAGPAVVGLDSARPFSTFIRVNIPIAVFGIDADVDFVLGVGSAFNERGYFYLARDVRVRKLPSSLRAWGNVLQERLTALVRSNLSFSIIPPEFQTGSGAYIQFFSALLNDRFFATFPPGKIGLSLYGHELRMPFPPPNPHFPPELPPDDPRPRLDRNIQGGQDAIPRPPGTNLVITFAADFFGEPLKEAAWEAVSGQLQDPALRVDHPVAVTDETTQVLWIVVPYSYSYGWCERWGWDHDQGKPVCRQSNTNHIGWAASTPVTFSVRDTNATRQLVMRVAPPGQPPQERVMPLAVGGAVVGATTHLWRWMKLVPNPRALEEFGSYLTLYLSVAAQ